MTSVLKRTGSRIAIIYILAVLAAMTVSEPVTELGKIAREFHPGSAFLTGLIMSLPSLVVALGALASGYIVDKFGDRPVFMAGSVIAILGDLGVIAAPTLQLLLAARLLTGIGYVLASVGSVTIMMRVTSGKQRTMALTLWSTTFPVSFIIPFLTAGLADWQGTWRAVFANHAVMTAIFILLALFSLPKPDLSKSSAQPSRFAGLGAVLKSPWPYLLGLANAANALRLTGVMAVLGPYLAGRYGVNVYAVQRLNVIAMACSAIGGLMVGRLLNRGLRAHLLAVFGLIVSTIALVAIVGAPIGYEGSILTSWLYTFTCGMLVGMWALVPRCAPSPASMGGTSGLITQLTLLGVLLGAPWASWATSTPNPAPMHILNVVTALICLACGLPVWLRGVGTHPSGPHGSQAAAEAK
jgi:predicted MFS family arabinose efflux permease